MAGLTKTQQIFIRNTIPSILNNPYLSGLLSAVLAEDNTEKNKKFITKMQTQLKSTSETKPRFKELFPSSLYFCSS